MNGSIVHRSPMPGVSTSRSSVVQPERLDSGAVNGRRYTVELLTYETVEVGAHSIIAEQDVAVTAFTGDAALSVTQPAIAASGTITEVFTGTAALSVTQPAIAASGSLIFSGTAALSVTAPAIAGSGTLTVTFTGTAALTVPAPQIAGVGTGPPSGAGGRKPRVVVRRPRVPYSIPRPQPEPAEAVLSVRPPRIRAYGEVVDYPAERRLVTALVDDEDLALALIAADTWLN